MKKKTIAVIGGGPAGFISAVSAVENSGDPENLQVDIFEKSVPLKTILYTGNGRCNLSNNISDFKELASNYPRGEKFLYSVFSRFGTAKTIQWFESKGIKTYVQEDNRIFPVTNRAATIRELFLQKTKEYGIKIIKSCATDVLKDDNSFIIRTETDFHRYDAVIISTGGNRKNSNNGYAFAKKLGHNVTPLKPSLTPMSTQEKWSKNLAGVTIKNCEMRSFFKGKKISDFQGDFIFTHQGIAGPVVFNTSSCCAFLEYSDKNPLLLKINFVPSLNNEELSRNLLSEINNSPAKLISNVLKKYIPGALAKELLTACLINPDKKASFLSKKEKEILLKILCETELKAAAPDQKGEIVTAGGIDLKQVNSRTMESKIAKGLFFCGEILDIDGLTGGFNLQMCWSTGYIAGLNAAGQENHSV